MNCIYCHVERHLGRCWDCMVEVVDSAEYEAWLDSLPEADAETRDAWAEIDQAARRRLEADLPF